jgi:hypothetical protein
MKTTRTTADLAAALQREYDTARRLYVEIGTPLLQGFERELQAAEAVIRGTDDVSPEATAARQRVREALHAAAGIDPTSEVARARALLARIKHELRRVTLAPTDHFPQET